MVAAIVRLVVVVVVVTEVVVLVEIVVKENLILDRSLHERTYTNYYTSSMCGMFLHVSLMSSVS